MIISVSQLNNLIKGILDSEAMLSRLKVRGEISQLKRTQGYCYFTIKDENASADCFCVESLKLPLVGESVIVECSPSYHTGYGRLSFYVSSATVENKQGELYAKYLKLKEKLEKEGLFAQERKRTINVFGKKIGVITSAQGAAVRDIINIVRRRNRQTDILIYPSRVQGEKAVEELIDGLSFFNTKEDIDTVIIGRGGGSFEDLNCFNDERLVRAVAKCRHPIISAVGHETDFTLCDFVADLRAPTPSAAAELATMDSEGLKYEIIGLLGAARRAVGYACESKKNRSVYIMKRACLVRESALKGVSHKIDRIMLKAMNVMQGRLEQKGKIIEGLKRRTEICGLKLTGQAYITIKGKPVVSVAQLCVGAKIEGKLSDGLFSGEITEVKKDA